MKELADILWIAFLAAGIIAFLFAISYFLRKKEGVKTPPAEKQAKAENPLYIPAENTEGEEVAAVMAAVAIYMEALCPGRPFVVRSLRRLRR